MKPHFHRRITIDTYRIPILINISIVDQDHNFQNWNNISVKNFLSEDKAQEHPFS